MTREPKAKGPKAKGPKAKGPKSNDPTAKGPRDTRVTKGLYDRPESPQGAFYHEIPEGFAAKGDSSHSLDTAARRHDDLPVRLPLCAPWLDLHFGGLYLSFACWSDRMTSFVSYYFDKAVTHMNWMFNTMDVTQWAIASLVMVTLGFIAIKFR